MMERTLSKTEAKFVLDLEWRNQKTVTLTEMREASENYARLFAHRLVKKGWLERLRPGLFQLIPADRGPEGVADTNPLAAGAVLVSRRRWRTTGKLVRTWNVVENVPRDVLIPKEEKPRRRVVRSRKESR